MHEDLEAKTLFKGNNLSEYRSNINTTTMYPNLRVVAEFLLLTISTSRMAEAGFSYVHTI